jgi:hypothetical protein
MAERACEHCGGSLEGRRANARFDKESCRKAAKRKPRPEPAAAPKSTVIADKLHAEFEQLGLLDSYEAQTALGIARQLDDKVVIGTAYVSLSKELDRRVDALRLKAVREDNPVTPLKASVQAKLRSA